MSTSTGIVWGQHKINEYHNTSTNKLMALVYKYNLAIFYTTAMFGAKIVQRKAKGQDGWNEEHK